MKKKRSIEGLRGITVSMIVLFHVIYRYQQLYIQDQVMSDYLGISKWGEIGVSIFLMISAYFLIESNKETLLRYVKKKILRLWPQYFVAISVIFLVTRFIYLPERTVTIYDYFLNCFFINGYIGTPYVDGAHWYLTVLIGMYFVYAISSHFKLEKKLYWCTAWIVLAVLFKAFSKVCDFQIFDIMYRLLGGDFIGLASWGILTKQIQNKKLNRKDTLIILISIGLSLGYAIAINSVWRIIGAAIGIVLVNICVNFDPSILKLKPLVFLGTISYPLYLIHQNLSYIIMRKLQFVCSSLLSKIVTIGIILCISYIMYKLELCINRTMIKSGSVK